MVVDVLIQAIASFIRYFYYSHYNQKLETRLVDLDNKDGA